MLHVLADSAASSGSSSSNSRVAEGARAASSHSDIAYLSADPVVRRLQKKKFVKKVLGKLH